MKKQRRVKVKQQRNDIKSRVPDLKVLTEKITHPHCKSKKKVKRVKEMAEKMDVANKKEEVKKEESQKMEK